MITYGVGEYYSKKYANTSDYRYAVTAMIGYIITAYSFIPAITRMNALTILGTIWNIGYMLITLFLGLVIFKEVISPLQTLGLIFGIISIILLSI